MNQAIIGRYYQEFIIERKEESVLLYSSLYKRVSWSYDAIPIVTMKR